MIPRIHRRGTSFKTAALYILHDPRQSPQQSGLSNEQDQSQGQLLPDLNPSDSNQSSKHGAQQTSQRVSWSACLNLDGVEPADAWRAMYDTWDARTALKRGAGVDLRGRDNKTPVMHFSLSWAPGEQPTPEQMLEAAKASLKALKLEQHQALVAAHHDKDHLHVHVIVNTVHPETGRTAPLKFSQRELMAWAREYERNNDIAKTPSPDREAETGRPAKKQEPTPEQLLGSSQLPPKPRPARQQTRTEAVAKGEIIDRMKRLAAEIKHRQLVERDATWSQHRAERQDLEARTREAAGIALDYVRDKFRGPWRELLTAQRDEAKHVTAIQGNPLARAAFVVWNADRLAGSRNLTTKEKTRLIASPTALLKAVDHMHMRERRLLSNVQKVETKTRIDRVWEVHRIRFEALQARQDVERSTQRSGQAMARVDAVSFAQAKSQLQAEHQGVAPPRMAANAPQNETDKGYVARIEAETKAFHARNTTPRPQMNWQSEPDAPPANRAEDIRRSMAAWKKQNNGRDFGNEI